MSQPNPGIPEVTMPQWGALTEDQQRAYEMLHGMETARATMLAASIIMESVSGEDVPNLDPLRQRLGGMSLSAVQALNRSLEASAQQLQIPPYDTPAPDDTVLRLLTPMTSHTTSAEASNPPVRLLPPPVDRSAETHDVLTSTSSRPATQVSESRPVAEEPVGQSVAGSKEDKLSSSLNRRQKSFIRRIYYGDQAYADALRLSGEEVVQLARDLAPLYLKHNNKAESAKRQVDRLVKFLEGMDEETIALSERPPVSVQSLPDSRTRFAQILREHNDAEALREPLQRILALRQTTPAVVDPRTSAESTAEVVQPAAPAVTLPAQRPPTVPAVQLDGAQPETNGRPVSKLEAAVLEFGDAVGLNTLQKRALFERLNRTEITPMSDSATEALKALRDACAKIDSQDEEYFMPLELNAQKLLQGIGSNINKPLPGIFVEGKLRDKIPRGMTITDVFESLFTKINAKLRQK